MRVAYAAALLAMMMLSWNAVFAGKFSGPVQVEWGKDGRKMRLLNTLIYTDSFGKDWIAPAGSWVDGASIPQVAWSFIGAPFEGKYRDASVIHDVYCMSKSAPWSQVHRTFYQAMLDNGVEGWRAQVMYAAVYHFGPRWPVNFIAKNNTSKPTEIPAELRASLPAGTTFTILPLATIDPFNTLIRADPPSKTLTLIEFDRLKQQIELRAKGGLVSNGFGAALGPISLPKSTELTHSTLQNSSNPMSLTEIENFK